jgi:hypothetical protein
MTTPATRRYCQDHYHGDRNHEYQIPRRDEGNQNPPEAAKAAELARWDRDRRAHGSLAYAVRLPSARLPYACASSRFYAVLTAPRLSLARTSSGGTAAIGRTSLLALCRPSSSNDYAAAGSLTTSVDVPNFQIHSRRCRPNGFREPFPARNRRTSATVVMMSVSPPRGRSAAGRDRAPPGPPGASTG